MIRVFKSGEVARADILYRGESGSTQAVEDAVADILADVKKNGDAAVLRYCEKFDGVKLAGLRVAQADIDAAYEAADPEFIRTLTMAAGNIEAFHKRQIRRNFVINDTPGVVLGQKVTPIERVGLYVPGGTASYPSSVLMNAIPARLAGVSEIIMVTPPAKDGSVAPAILTAARVAGVTAIYKMGGAQAVAALAYGTESVPKVDKIVGPGNIFVAAAKRRVYGIVDIDMIAGPSEILVLADAAANPAYVAADLLSQAEHDRLATAVLVRQRGAGRGGFGGAGAADSLAAPGGHRPRVHRQQRQDHHCTGHGRGRGHRQRDRARASGGLRGRPVQPFEQHPQRGQHLFGKKRARGAGRLFRRAEPHAAHAGDGALFQPAFRG